MYRTEVPAVLPAEQCQSRAKELYIRLLLGYFKKQTISSISPQDCRNCRTKLQTRQNKRKKESELSSASINRIMSTLSKIFSLACEEGILERNPMQYVKALPEPPLEDDC
ncbi:MAG: site-specific integrase [Acidobacteria bacterium]|nr:site-specific integrase [Acidobacteriota bacterium]